jgi:hypothetical protein
MNLRQRLGATESRSIFDWSALMIAIGGMQMSVRILSTREKIEQRAYELYLARGGEGGDDLADWLAAERELTELPEQSNSSAPKARAAAANLQATPPKVVGPPRKSP